MTRHSECNGGNNNDGNREFHYGGVVDIKKKKKIERKEKRFIFFLSRPNFICHPFFLPGGVLSKGVQIKQRHCTGHIPSHHRHAFHLDQINTLCNTFSLFDQNDCPSFVRIAFFSYTPINPLFLIPGKA